MNMTIRPRRLRTTPVLRKMVRETRMDASTLIYPMFVIEGTDIREEIPAMPGQYRVSLDHLAEELEAVTEAGVGASTASCRRPSVSRSGSSRISI